MSAEEETLVRLCGVGKVFAAGGVETHALSDVHLNLLEGEFVSIEGPSGCGKSTLLGILGLLDLPTSGTYRFDGAQMEDLPEQDRATLRAREIGFIFQSFNLIGDLSVFENVELGLVYRGDPTSLRRRKAETALERVGLAHRGLHLPSQLSGGQQQRVAVARAIAGEPRLLLADEPTGNLDSRSGESVMQLLRELHDRGSTLCMVTHDPRYTRYASRNVQLFDGRIVDESQS